MTSLRIIKAMELIEFAFIRTEIGLWYFTRYRLILRNPRVLINAHVIMCVCLGFS